ncbi:NAD-dependent deacetylase sirtuin-2 [Punctularia strigosozonata HHB-11173 SS5]|uniref:NAD-dependent deacetylase sirtuin-2 n=1 Tax=Punctularia strigosozonata (strain HHB-11173) TaxID=741275 RepID=UPI0004418341|nr:NAD-dependent deacetylase sirtuin-2 [Punctularia strigosozonata HHB-11173 SS5]EIN12789.1 NAD-dependent deacetylase sirtuin-2 [Punctularia strigosozonata HHB-11173 SS5]
MGNQVSAEPYEGPPIILEGRDIPSLAKYIKSSACTNVFFMVGAGLSTAAGIPDFRSPETGLYANLARLNLPYPEAVFEISFFRENPEPFYALAKELDPASYRPTLSHSFIRLFTKPPPPAQHVKMKMCFTQNIDTLERRAGVPDNKIVEAHGSFADQHCIDCHAPYESDKLREKILKSEIAKCEQCGGLVKPDIVFFGEALPQRFAACAPMLRSADLLIIMGTSLKVHPFASLTQYVDCPRVLINLEPAGDIGTRPDDVLLLGKCDDIVRELCRELGPEWEAELDRLWAETAPDAAVPSGSEKEEMDEQAAEKHAEKGPADEVDSLVEAVEKALDLSSSNSNSSPNEAGKEGEQVSSSELKPEDVEAKAEEHGKLVDEAQAIAAQTVADPPSKPVELVQANVEDGHAEDKTTAQTVDRSEDVPGKL